MVGAEEGQAAGDRASTAATQQAQNGAVTKQLEAALLWRHAPLRLTLCFPPLPGHTLGNSAAWLHAWLHARNVSDWVGRLALVVHTPLGMALPRHWRPLVGPLVPAHPIQTLAE